MLTFKQYSNLLDEGKLDKVKKAIDKTTTAMGENPIKTLGSVIGGTIGTASALRHGGDPIVRGTMGALAGHYAGIIPDRIIQAYRKSKK